ncbi:retinaldehyde dehydrogenase [Salpingoeca rosetta]|uniref:Retinaldehyde dehydrogenase n=1 Tax=Salpingoeca rosetta (strain ATCC 50818 / BSB-021) TaxID=946362 RepID=F2USL7_SALR5|nr:retinaldehyde dehydrogenase [Salpingoeca rosetta]EGD81126.1 retinaldehyde dehydrogenase [Salpingoeca rosetta]|eukprot:XP_004987811.1 retinaldehyde dehydrogenase [Salpingoeca rosetta]
MSSTTVKKTTAAQPNGDVKVKVAPTSTQPPKADKIADPRAPKLPPFQFDASLKTNPDDVAPTGTKPPVSVAEVFETLAYGPAPESPAVANAWLDDHGRDFGHFVNNKWYKRDGRSKYECRCPARDEFLAHTAEGDDEDVDVAMKAAHEAHKTWSKLPGHVRARYIYSIARHVQKHIRLLAVVESLDNGKPIRETRDADMAVVARWLYHYAGWAQVLDREMPEMTSVGVVAGIVAWNFPLMLLVWKVAPALAAGNTIVMKPADYTPLSALLFAEICAEAGLPPGVFNVVTGAGATGAKVAAHPLVDKLAFTGSTGVGRILRRVTAGTGKKLSLELGGKSPVIVFDDADLDGTIEGVIDAIFFNQGQVCSAGSRLLIQEPVFDKFVAKLKERMTHLRVGDCLDKCVDIGAIVDDKQRKTIDGYVQMARDEGCDVYQACSCIPDKGCYYPPTLITNVDTSSVCVQEEIFGPVVTAQAFRTAKEAVALANNTTYGLGASVWSENLSKALELSLMIKAGTVWINAHNLFDAAAGFGGYRESGFGRDGGKEGLYEYTKPKHLKLTKRDADKIDISSFGKVTPHRPSLDDERAEVATLGPHAADVPSVDRTYKMYYGGAQKRPDAPYARPIRNAAGKVIAHVGEGNRKDVRNAVEAAHKAFPGWGKRAAHNRAQIVYYMAENLEVRRVEVATRLASTTGVSQEDALKEVDAAIDRLFYWGAYADKYGGAVQETTLYGATVKIHEPVGPLAILCPDENPLLSFVSLFAPAIVRGNTVLIVPSEKYPLSALDFYQVFDTSDLPGGVVNILTGERDHLAKYMAEHQNLEAVWYFGSVEGSKFVEYTAAENIKRTWVNYGQSRDWFDPIQGAGEEFFYQAVEVKNIWMPMGTIFAN